MLTRPSVKPEAPHDDIEKMRRPVAIAAALTALALVPASGTASGSAKNWAQPEIRIVVAHGLLAPSVASFRPNDPLVRSDLADLEAGLTDSAPVTVPNPTASVTMAGLDSGLVGALGLAATARSFYLAARDAGLAPPARFGSEVVARLLELRYNHLAAHDDLELLPSDPATRAEAAYSAARILGFSGSETDDVTTASLSFVLPELTPWQKRILRTALHLIGYPYVWGGTSELPEAPFRVQAHGGFDCSGFVWRVYKLQKYAGGSALSKTLRGRTTYQMSGEVPRSERVTFANLQPADVLFFGAAGPHSKPAQVDHTGIYLGNGWFIHSSSQGVYLSTLTGWYRDRFAWARRPLAEAGLDPSR
jgi:cell wall-associated NlpC family hydrolase